MVVGIGFWMRQTKNLNLKIWKSHKSQGSHPWFHCTKCCSLQVLFIPLWLNKCKERRSLSALWLRLFIISRVGSFDPRKKKEQVSQRISGCFGSWGPTMWLTAAGTTPACFPIKIHTQSRLYCESVTLLTLRPPTVPLPIDWHVELVDADDPPSTVLHVAASKQTRCSRAQVLSLCRCHRWNRVFSSS